MVHMFQPTQKNLDDLSHFLGGFRGTFFRDYIVLQKIWLNNKKCGLAEGVKIVHRHDLFFYSSIIAMYPFLETPCISTGRNGFPKYSIYRTPRL